MARFSFISRKVSVGAFAALTAFGSLAQPGTAAAKPPICPGCNVAQMKGQMMLGAAALGGVTVGLLAASAAQGGSGYCTIVRRQAVDEFGNYYIRRVRICQ